MSTFSGPDQGPWTVTFSSVGISPTNTTFYDKEQLLYLLVNNGQPMVNVTVGLVDHNAWYNTAVAMSLGAQAGGCAVMFFVVLALSKENKRKTAIFILNVLSLLFGFLRNILLALYFVSPFVNFYPYYASDYSSIPRSTYATMVTATIMPLLLTTTVNLSMVLQAHTVTKNMQGFYRYPVIAGSVLIFFLALAFHFAQSVMNSMVIVASAIFDEEWIMRASTSMETISIWYFSIIFTSKLVYTLYYRRKNGWQQWSGVKILAAMGGCTMIIPALFTILEYLPISINSFPEAGSISLTLVALLLPLSSLWASMAIHDESSRFTASPGSGVRNNSHSSSPLHYRSGATMTSGARTNSTATDCEKAGFVEHVSPSTVQTKISGGRDSTEMDLEAMGVRVDKSYSLQSHTGAGPSTLA